MFQYAAARALARGQQLLLDVSGYDDYRLHHGFELRRVFRCQAELAGRGDVRKILGWRAAPLARGLLSRRAFAGLRGRAFIVEPHFHYWPGIRAVPEAAYLQGYWQSEKYFEQAAAEIRADFAFRQPMSEANAAWAERIGRCNAVSLHVRRGDYVSDAKTRATLQLCAPEYYRAAIGHVAERVAKPEFFVFSDDMPWVRANLDIGFPCHYIDHNLGAESYRDMQLMGLCRHHIIANSSFSWWGAWLNPDPGKIVVAPEKWFANGNRVDDLIPASWVKL